MKLRVLAVAAMTMCVAATCVAQRSTSPRPKWLSHLPEPTNNTFRYELCRVIAPSLDGARSVAIDQLVGASGLKNGVVTMSESTSKRTLNQHWVNGQLSETYDVNNESVTDIKGTSQKLFIDRVAEYWERKGGEYRYTALFAKSDLGRAPLFDNVYVTRRYGARGLWRSMIVPGWGQIYKGSVAKGASIFGATALCAVGIVFTDNQRADYVKKIKRTHDASLIKSYRVKRDHWTAGRNICIGATAALYLYNVIDAVAAPGAERLVVRNYGRNGGSYSFLPVVDVDGSFGLSANLTF